MPKGSGVLFIFRHSTAANGQDFEVNFTQGEPSRDIGNVLISYGLGSLQDLLLGTSLVFIQTLFSFQGLLVFHTRLAHLPRATS